MDEISLLALMVCRKWSSFATRELRRSAVELSSLLHWQAMDMFTHLDKVHVTEKCPFRVHSCCVSYLPSVCPSERLIGLPDSMLKHKSTPQVVPSLEGLFIEDIAVGCEHVLALSCTGDVYAWGCNSEGQVSIHLSSITHFDSLKWCFQWASTTF